MAVGLSGALFFGCSGGGDKAPTGDGGVAQDGNGGGGEGGASGSTSGGPDGSMTDASGGDAGKGDAGDLFGGPPYERIKLPVRRLSLAGEGYCVILEDRTLQCGGIRTFEKTAPPSGAANHDFVAVTQSSTANDIPPMALRSDGTVIRWSWSTGSLNTPRPPGSGYIGYMLWGVGPTQATICGLTPMGKLECAGEPAPAAVLERTFVQVSNTGNTPWGLTPEGEILAYEADGTWTRRMPKARFVSLDHGHSEGRCGVDTEGALRCWPEEDRIQAMQVRDYALAAGQELCFVTAAGAFICQSLDGSLLSNGVRVWKAPGADEYVDVETDGARDFCGITTKGKLNCFDSNDPDDPGREILLAKPAAISD